MKRFILALWAVLGFAGLFAAGAAQSDPANGVYRITPRGQQGMCLDIEGFTNADGANISLYPANHTSNQQWMLERQTDGTYKVYAYSGKNSIQMLDLSNGSTANGNTVKTYEDNGNSAQRWYLSDTGGGWYRFIPANAGPNGSATLDISGGNGAGQGARTGVYDYWGGDNQVFRLDWAGVSQAWSNGKKGIGGRETKVPYLNGSWVYNWGGQEPADEPTGVEFVPMAWGYYGGTDTSWLQWASHQPGVKNILAFNEPDHTDQANLSVPYAEQGFALFRNLGVPVGSPACADDNDSWFQSFFNDVDPNNSFITGSASSPYRMDFITVHCYIRDPYQFENYITALHNWRWQYPLWITEFAPTNWAGTDGVTPQEAANFMRIVVPWLNSQWYVARYAWYTGASPGPWTLGPAALVNTDGTLTDLGKLYGRM